VHVWFKNQGNDLLGLGTIVQAWLELHIQIQAKWDKRFVFGGTCLSRKEVFTKMGMFTAS
jgi:hypothetical protein